MKFWRESYCLILLLLSIPLCITASFREPATIDEVRSLVHDAANNNKKIALVGADKSMGGQTYTSDGYRISLRTMNNLLFLDKEKKEVTVQAGMTWKELQHSIAPFGFAVKTMQSYYDFSIGGSLSVNVHGQGLHDTPLIKSVVSMKVMNAQGDVVFVDRNHNVELFNLVIGGYGLFGIILEVTLSLADDCMYQRKVTLIETDKFVDYFKQHIQHNDSIDFFSARFSLKKSEMLQKMLLITYERTHEPRVQDFRLGTYYSNGIVRNLLRATAFVPLLKNVRFFLEHKALKKKLFISRNNISYNSLAGLPQSNNRHLYFLQEYFIPYEHVNDFIKGLASLINIHNVNILNVTARHVERDTETYLSYAPTDCCALVLYVHARRNQKAYNRITEWTQQLIDKALACKGSYYLPYQLLATPEQIRKAYPLFDACMRLKKSYDPYELFSNQLYVTYGVII